MAGQSRPWAIGIDVGGTKIAAAAVDTARGAVAHRQEIATRPERGAMAVLEDLVSLTQRVAEAARGDGLAVGTEDSRVNIRERLRVGK